MQDLDWDSNDTVISELELTLPNLSAKNAFPPLLSDPKDVSNLYVRPDTKPTCIEY
jgi:hypothetical protein